MRQRFTVFFLLVLLGAEGLAPSLAWARGADDPFIKQWSYETVGAPEAWDYTTGSHDVVVAVIDNGIVASHPDLAPNMWRNEAEVSGNGLDDDANGFVDDVNGWDFVANDNDPTPDAQVVKGDRSDIAVSHATAVAGIIGAVGNNGRDGAGIAWQVRLMNVRVADNEGDGRNSRLAAAIRYAVQNGADIINLSINSQVTSDDLSGALLSAVEKGVAVFAAAGNLGVSYSQVPSFPVCSDRGKDKQWVIGLSAVGQDRRLTDFSSFGRDCIDLTAPGEEISSASWYGVSGYAYGWAGTSFAAPFASGAAALVKALRPEWKADDIYRALQTRVTHTCAAPDAEYQEWYGNGLLRIDRAVRATAAGPWKTSSASAYPYIINTNLWAAIDSGRIEDWALPTSTARTNAFSRGHFTLGVFASANAVATYRQFPCTRYYAVAKTQDKKTQRITVYDSNWETVGSWSVAATSPVLLAFSQVAGEEVRVAVAQNQPSKIVAELYSVTGTRAGLWELAIAHKGVTQLTSVPNNGNLSLAAIVSQTKNNQLITAAGTTGLGAVDLPRADYRLTAADFNGTGEGTVMIAPAVTTTTVKLYSLAGEWQLSYSLIAPGLKWNWTANDYNDNGRADLIMYATAGTGGARVYDHGGRLIDELALFTDNPAGRRWLLWP